MGQQGPGGIPQDNSYVERPKNDVILPEQYKVKGLQQN